MVRTFIPAVSLSSPSPESCWFACGANGLLVHVSEDGLGGEPRVRLPDRDELTALGLRTAAAHYLGRLGDKDCFALWLPQEVRLGPGMAVYPLRKLYGLVDEALFAVAGRAWQIAYWDDTHRYCGRCATPLVPDEKERCKRCPSPTCGLSAFPRVAPAVIVLVRRGAQALLGHAAHFPAGRYSTLAGFVEPGESLEEAVVREIREEAGITVTGLRYFGSQPWPFPHSLMVGFFAEYESGELRPDGTEILDVRWFDADATTLPKLPPPLSIARRLIDTWLVEAGAGAERAGPARAVVSTEALDRRGGDHQK